MANRQPGSGGVAGHEGLLEQRLAVLEIMLEPVIVWRLGGAIVYWNEAARRLYGYTREDAIGRVTQEMLQTEFPDDCGPEAVEAALAQTKGPGSFRIRGLGLVGTAGFEPATSTV